MTKLKTTSQNDQNEIYFSDWDRNLLSLIHELSGPLTAARLNLDHFLINANLTSLDYLSANIKLMEDYLNNTRQLIKHTPQLPRTFAVDKQLNNLLKNLAPLADQKQVKLITSFTDNLTIRGNPTKFKQIISCFIRNAIEAYDDSSHTNRLVLINRYKTTDYLVVEVCDHGSGISKANKTKIFSPYYSTKKSVSGMGLGLSLATESISREFKGYVEVESNKLNGTVFRLFFKLPLNIGVVK